LVSGRRRQLLKKPDRLLLLLLLYWLVLANKIHFSGCIKIGKFVHRFSNYQLLKRNPAFLPPSAKLRISGDKPVLPVHFNGSNRENGPFGVFIQYILFHLTHVLVVPDKLFVAASSPALSSVMAN
jgi:hypothetical protein